MTNFQSLLRGRLTAWGRLRSLLAASALAVVLVAAIAARAAAATVIPAGNLLPNPSFESSLSCWNGWQSSLSRFALAGAPDGSYVAKVQQSTGTQYSIDSGACPTSNVTAGSAYQATAYLEAASASSAGKAAYVHLRERNSFGATVADSASPAVNLAVTGFAAATISARLLQAGDVFDVYVLQTGAAAGDAFYTDAVSLAPVGGTSSSGGSDLLSNPLFLNGVSCWNGWHSSLLQGKLQNAPGGSDVAEVGWVSGTAYSIDSDACPTSNVTAGATYLAQGYVMAASASSAGKQVFLHLRERNSSGATVADTASAGLALPASGFGLLSVQAPLKSSGDVLDLYVLQASAASGDAFYTADEFLGLATGTPPSPAASPSAAPSPTPLASPSPSPSPSPAPAPSPSPSSTPSGAPLPDGVGGTWNLTLDDEFNGTSVNKSLWNVDDPTSQTCGQWSQATFSASMVSEANGALVMRTQRTSSGTYLGAEICAPNFKQAYGFWEARIWEPAGQALWPAVWLKSTYEMDFPELSGSSGQQSVSMWTDHNWSNNTQTGVAITSPFNLTQGYHVFGMDWTSSSVRYYIDGTQVGSNSYVPPSNTGELYLDLAAGDCNWNYIGCLSSSTPSSATMYIDYMRVWTP